MVGGAIEPEPSGRAVVFESISMCSGVSALGARYCGLEAMSMRSIIRANPPSIFVAPLERARGNGSVS